MPNDGDAYFDTKNLDNTTNLSVETLSVIGVANATSGSGTTGSISALGGASIAKDLYVGGTIYGTVSGGGGGGGGGGGDATSLLGKTWASPDNIGSTAPATGTFTTVSSLGNIAGTQVISNASTGTAPLVVSSTTKVANLNASLLDGKVWQAPNPIGSTTPSTGAFTTLSSTGTTTASQLVSTTSTGTAPLTVASTTQVANLNASQLQGSTWSAPAAIGGTTAAAGTFTTLASTSTSNATSGAGTSGAIRTLGGASIAQDCLVGGSVGASGAVASTSSSQAIDSAGNSGGLRTFGGASIAKDTWIGGKILDTDTTNSASFSSGSMVLAGGMGVAKNLHIQTGSGLFVRDKYHGVQYDSSIDGPQLFGASGGKLVVYDPVTETKIDSASWSKTQVRVLQNTQATDGTGTTGSLCTLGGASIARDLYVGGTIYGTTSSAGDADTLDGKTWEAPGTIGSITPNTGAFTTLSSSGTTTASQLVSTVATGTAPLTVASSTQVANLNASQLQGSTWAAPAAIGSTTPSTGAFTTLSSSGSATASQLVSTASTGTAPLTVASTTQVANLNASLLQGGTWAAPASIGGTTAAAGTFTTLASTSTTNATSSAGTSGALSTLGGASIAKDAWIGGKIVNTDTTNSSDSTNGALVLAGGIGVAKNVNIQSGSGLFVRDMYHGLQYDVSIDGPQLFGASGGKLVVYDPVTDLKTDSLSWSKTQVRVLRDTQATDATGTTGSLCTLGGASIAKDLYVGGTLYASGGVGDAATLQGKTWEAPGSIGSSIPSSGAFTALSASGDATASRFISTTATGTAPLTVASSTQVANLNASLLQNFSWETPGSIGSTTPSSGSFTTLTATCMSRCK